MLGAWGAVGTRGGPWLSALCREGTVGAGGRVCSGGRAGGKPNLPSSCPASVLHARGLPVFQEPTWQIVREGREEKLGP